MKKTPPSPRPVRATHVCTPTSPIPMAGSPQGSGVTLVSFTCISIVQAGDRDDRISMDQWITYKLLTMVIIVVKVRVEALIIVI